MPDKLLPSPAYLRQRLRYDPDTGLLFWLDDPSMPNNWRALYAGKEAFTACADGYRKGSIGSRSYLAHRVAWAIHHGSWPKHEVDHINHDRADNRIANLRDVDHSTNKRNAPRMRTNTSGMTGVHWDAAYQRWAVQIYALGRSRYLGRFDSFDDAVAARKAGEIEHAYHPNHGS